MLKSSCSFHRKAVMLEGNKVELNRVSPAKDHPNISLCLLDHFALLYVDLL